MAPSSQLPEAMIFVDSGNDNSRLTRSQGTGRHHGIPSSPKRQSAGETARVPAELPQPFTTSQARQALSTSRRVAIPLPEYLDRARVTERLPGDLRRLRALPAGPSAADRGHRAVRLKEG